MIRTKPGVVTVTVPPGALIDAALMLVWACRLTVGTIGLTGFVATGLTAIAPVATAPLLLVALTAAPLISPTVKSREAAKVIFSVAVILTGAVLGTIVLRSLKTPNSPELLVTSTLVPCKIPKFTSPKALSSIAPFVPISIDLVTILPRTVFRLILPLISAGEMSLVKTILLLA